MIKIDNSSLPLLTKTDAPPASGGGSPIAQYAQKKISSNGDFDLTPTRTRAYVVIDLVGGTRQGAASTQAVSLLAHASSSVARVAGSMIPFALLLTGPACMAVSAAWTIPDALTALEDAKIGSDPEVIEMEKLGVANHCFFFGMGAAQTGLGVVSLLTPETAHILHYSPVLKGAVATTVTAVAGVILGGAYVARGSVMLARTLKSYHLSSSFQKEFKEHIRERKFEKAINLMNRSDAYLARRLDMSCLDSELKPETISPENKMRYLQGVNRGIYSQQLKHRIGITIAIAMILGGALAIALSIMSGGILPLIVGLASAIFFMSMEYIFLTYDSSAAFEWLRDRLYCMPPELTITQDRANALL